MRAFGRDIPIMFALVFWALAWEIVGRAELVFLVPPFTHVLAALAEMVQTGKFQDATLLTFESFALGMGLALLLGIPLGVLMGRVEAAEKLLGTWVNVFVSAPLTALVPVIMILFGLGQTTIVVTVMLFAVWIIVLNTRAGVMQINRSLIEMARSFGASPFDAFTKIYFWAALPEILGGVRIGFIRGVKGVIIGQLLISIVGFGSLFELYASNFLMKHFWAVLLVLFALSFLIAEFLAWLERKVEYYASSRN